MCNLSLTIFLRVWYPQLGDKTCVDIFTVLTLPERSTYNTFFFLLSLLGTQIGLTQFLPVHVLYNVLSPYLPTHVAPYLHHHQGCSGVK